LDLNMWCPYWKAIMPKQI